MSASPKTSLWRNTPFQLMWTSAAASGFGDQVMQSAALVLLGAWSATADTSAAAAANKFFFFLPYVVLSVAAGWLADKLPRRMILMGCDFARAGVLLKGALLITAAATLPIPDGTQWKVCAALLAVGGLAATFYPARYAMIPALVGQERVQMGNAVIGSVTLIASMLGLVACGQWMKADDAGSVRQALVFAAVLYAVAGVAFAFMRVPRHAHDPALTAGHGKGGGKASGTGYILSHRRTLNLNLLYLLVWAVAMLSFAAVPAVGKMNFGLHDQDLQQNATLLGGAMGLGLFLGAVFMAVLPTRRQGGVVMLLALVPTGLAMAGLAATPWMPLCFACALLAGFFGHIAMIGCVTLIQSTTPDYVLGRVMGLNSMLSTVGLVGVNLVVGLPEIARQANHLDAGIRLPAGYAADHWILRATVISGLALAALGAWYGLRHWTRGIFPSRATNLFWRLTNFLCLAWHRTVWIGRENVPAHGPAILSMNHTAALDPFLVQSGLNRMVRWLMMDKYMFGFMKPLWDAIDPIVLRKGEKGGVQIRTMINELKKDCVIGIFPEGGLQRTQRIVRPFKIGVAVLAKRTGVPVVPVWIHGTPLSDSVAVHVFKPCLATIVYGKPLLCGAEETEDAFLKRLRQAMLDLRAKVPADRRQYAEPDPDDAHPLPAHTRD